MTCQELENQFTSVFGVMSIQIISQLQASIIGS
jgi:hypothetical protein